MHFSRKLSLPVIVCSLIVFASLAVSARAADKRTFRMGFTPFVYDQTLEAVADMEKFLREKGSEAVSFDIIVASGPNGALPHARPTERRISPGEPTVVDLGSRVGGYCSDLTRTLCLGPRSGTFAEVYNLVLRAQLSALDNLEVGMLAEKADNLARKVIQEGGYGDAFGHGLGHGVGLAVHEQPRLGPNSTAVLEEGMVFTVEPGIYLAGWGGVRIEDVVMMKDGKAKVLTRVGK